MSTHNIGFYEDLTKIIFELSSNFIKFAPYFFFCKRLKCNTNLVVLKPLYFGRTMMSLISLGRHAGQSTSILYVMSFLPPLLEGGDHDKRTILSVNSITWRSSGGDGGSVKIVKLIIY